MTVDVFHLRTDSEHFESLRPVNGRGFDELKRFYRSDPLPEGWLAPTLEVMPEDDGSVLPESDFPRVAGPLPVLSENAYAVLKSLLDAHVSTFPFSVRGRTNGYIGLNVGIVRAIDWKNSDALRTPSGQIMRVNRYSFHQEVVRARPLFRDASVLRMVFATTPFLEAVSRGQLKGALFEPCESGSE